MSSQRAEGRVLCVCGKRLAARVPDQGDGSLLRVRVHGGHPGDRCPGSWATYEWSDLLPTPPQDAATEVRLCPTCGKPAEVPGEGRYCGSCEDYEGHCAEDHCMTCGAST